MQIIHLFPFINMFNPCIIQLILSLIKYSSSKIRKESNGNSVDFLRLVSCFLFFLLRFYNINTADGLLCVFIFPILHLSPESPLPSSKISNDPPFQSPPHLQYSPNSFLWTNCSFTVYLPQKISFCIYPTFQLTLPSQIPSVERTFFVTQRNKIANV